MLTGIYAGELKEEAREESMMTHHENISTQQKDTPIVFACYGESNPEITQITNMIRSLRTFGGSFKEAPVWVYFPEDFTDRDTSLLKKLNALDVTLKTSVTPEDSQYFYFSGKVFAASKAEEDACSTADVLVWMDSDTLILKEPLLFNLPKGIAFGYRPVMHKLIGSAYGDPPDEFWQTIYQEFSLPDSAFYPMTTPGDQQTIRPYFNAGLLVVRPEKGILRQWTRNFQKLYKNSFFVNQCRQDKYKRIFLHQTALVPAVLKLTKKTECIEFPETVNYPLFFKKMFGATRPFDDINDAVTIRYEHYFQNPEPQWENELKAPPEIIHWLKTYLAPPASN